MENQKKIRSRTEAALSNWREKEKIALELLRIAGDLRFNHSIELVFFWHPVYDTRPSELLHIHGHSLNYTSEPISIETTLAITQAIALMDNISAIKVDLGLVAMEWLENKSKYQNVHEFVRDNFQDVVNTGNAKPIKPKDIILYGFGRIGRLVARRIIAQTGRGEQLRLKAIVVRQKMKTSHEELEKRAALLRYDSIHGTFKGVIKVDYEHEELIINGNRVKFIMANNPGEIDYTKYGIDKAMVIDNTGVWRDKEALSGHLRPGVEQVMLTAPGKEIPNIVYGINQGELKPRKDKVISAASCTTNAIVPILKVVDDAYGVQRGHIETIHAYTNDQNLLDNFHKKTRRGRGAPINMVLTTTGAAAAVGKVLPHLGSCLTGNAVRVPVPDGSIAILSLTLKKPTTVEKMNAMVKEAALHGELVEQIHYSADTEFVSSNLIGSTTACAFDAPSTIVSNDGLNVTLYAWYDNEYGYTCQVVRLAKYATGVLRKRKS